MSEKATTLALAAATILLWGLWGFFGKMALNRGMPPMLILLFEIAASFACVAVFALATSFLPASPWRPFSGAWNRYGILSGLGLVLGLLFYYLALSRGQATIIVPLTSIYPIVAAILSYVFLKEKLTPVQWIGVVVLTIGTLMVISGEIAPSTPRHPVSQDQQR